MKTKKKLSIAFFETAKLIGQGQFFSDNGADELFLCDDSADDTQHEAVIGQIKEFTRQVDNPLIAGGRVKRLEDIKKYLYAGASAVFLDVSKEENVDLIKEASDRFGQESIYAWFPSARTLSRVEEAAQLGASKMIYLAREEDQVDCLSSFTQPFFVICQKEAAGKWLSLPNVEGVLLLPKEQFSPMELKQELSASGIVLETFESTVSWDEFKLNEQGLIPAIVQDYKTGEVLMMAYMNRESFEKTLASGKMTYYSRSRSRLWLKGETSGHYQYVKELCIDCDKDTILAKVKQVGAACHTGAQSCFFTSLSKREYKQSNPLNVFEEVFSVILDRKKNPKEGSYTTYLFEKGLDKILKKCGEEATEIIIAAKNPDAEEIKYEISDFLYHVMVLMAEKDVSWEDITRELANR